MSLARLTGFLGLRRNIVGLLGMVVLVGLGEHMAEQFLPLYLIEIGGAALSIGFLNGIDNLLGALYSFPGGYLADHIGTKRALLVFNLMASVGFLIVILIPKWWAVMIGAVFFLSWTAISLPATMKLVACSLPSKKRTMGVTMHSLVRRIPMALGPLMGGLCIQFWGVKDGIRLAFVAALAVTFVATIIQQILIEEDRRDPKDPAARKAEHNPLRAAREISPALWRLLVADILVRFCEQIPYAFVVVWCTRIIAAPVSEFHFGILRSVEMATAILIYIPVAYFADRTQKKPFVVATFCFFTAFPLVLLFCHSFWPLVFAFVLRGLKEFGEPTRKALIMDLAPEDGKARVFGVYYLIRDGIVSIAAFCSGILWGIGGAGGIGPTITLLAAFGFGLVGTVWFAAAGRDLAPHPEPAAGTPSSQ